MSKTDQHRYKYLDALTTAFVVILLVSNLVAQKICRIGPLEVSGALVLFPITYIFGDLFTEVYGYAASRRAIWLGFFGTALLYIMGTITITLPASPQWHNQAAFEAVFGFIPRILIGSLVAYFFGEFANSYTMARMKLATQGRMLWTRTLGSTIVGQAVDTIIVMTLTFGFTMPWSDIGRLILSSYGIKVAYEALMTPLTYLVVNWLKKSEGIDAFDHNTSFNPFRFKN